MNRPTNTEGIAAGTATLRMRKRSLAPSVRANVVVGGGNAQRCQTMSRMATGNPVASAIRKTLALQLDGKAKKASGSHATAGSGPMKRRIGCSQ